MKKETKKRIESLIQSFLTINFINGRSDKRKANRRAWKWVYNKQKKLTNEMVRNIEYELNKDITNSESK